MGIRNLAYCLIRHNADATWQIEAWDNIDLLEGGDSAQNAKKCIACSSPARWFGAGKKWCQACASGVRRKKTASELPTLPMLPCAVTAKGLRELHRAATATAAQASKKGSLTKEQLVAWARERYLMPWKAAKAMDASLTVIRKAMDTWLDSVLPTFASATLIRLENQPVMKGPTMKSVQIILYTLLGHRLEREYNWNGAIEFVHAGTKSKGSAPVTVTVTDISGVSSTAAEGVAYRARKKSAEADVFAALPEGNPWRAFFSSRSKKSDLADAFLMALRK